jgi:threonine dehydrogenase-like Zn-dependent dehydrogenase
MGSGATMPAAVFQAVGQLAITERPVPGLESPDDLVLEVEACGICGTDLQILDDPPRHPATVGVILGHEFVGEVTEAGAEVRDLKPGDRVVVATNVSCGRCVWCRRGLRNHCQDFTTLGIFDDGGLAPRVRVPAANCHPISREVPPHIAAMAEPLSTVVNGVRLADVFPGETAVILGAGPAGLMYTALLTLAGASVVTVEPAPRRAEFAITMGAERVVDPTSEDAGAVVREATGGLGADVVVDAVGSQLPAALELVRKAGRVVLFGMNSEARATVAQERITRDELKLLGAFVGQDVFPPAIRLLEQGRVELEPLVTHRIQIGELPQAMAELREGRAVKVEVEFA